MEYNSAVKKEQIIHVHNICDSQTHYPEQEESGQRRTFVAWFCLYKILEHAN